MPTWSALLETEIVAWLISLNTPCNSTCMLAIAASMLSGWLGLIDVVRLPLAICSTTRAAWSGSPPRERLKRRVI